MVYWLKAFNPVKNLNTKAVDQIIQGIVVFSAKTKYMEECDLREK